MDNFPNYLRRESFSDKSTQPVKEGEYQGIIKNVKVKEFNSRYSPNGKRVALVLFIEITVDESRTETLLFSPTLDWHPKSNLTKGLVAINRLPEVNKELDIENLKNTPVLATVKNNHSNGRVFSNVISIDKGEPKVEEIDIDDIENLEEEMELDF